MKAVAKAERQNQWTLQRILLEALFATAAVAATIFAFGCLYNLHVMIKGCYPDYEAYKASIGWAYDDLLFAKCVDPENAPLLLLSYQNWHFMAFGFVIAMATAVVAHNYLPHSYDKVLQSGVLSKGTKNH